MIIIYGYLHRFFTEQNTRLESESNEDSKGKLSSEGILTLILPSNDRTDLLVRCTPCQRIYVGMDGWMRHKKVYLSSKANGTMWHSCKIIFILSLGTY